MFFRARIAPEKELKGPARMGTEVEIQPLADEQTAAHPAFPYPRDPTD